MPKGIYERIVGVNCGFQNCGFQKGHQINKGRIFTEEHKRKISITHKQRGTGKWMLGRHLSEETKRKISKANKGRKKPPRSIEHRRKLSFIRKNERSKYEGETQKEWRHRMGISKRYWNMSGLSHTKEYANKFQRIRNALLRSSVEIDKLTIQTFQLVYEDNIKQYGTLTCYLCLQPIPFGKDNLEHKIPLSRGGTNEYHNLAISCQNCNFKKHTKTENEYRRYLQAKGVING